MFLFVHRKLRKPPVRKIPSTLNFSLTALRCVLGCLIGVVLLGLILILVPLALNRLSKRLLSGDRRQPDSSKSLSGVLLLSPLWQRSREISFERIFNVKQLLGQNRTRNRKYVHNLLQNKLAPTRYFASPAACGAAD